VRTARPPLRRVAAGSPTTGPHERPAGDAGSAIVEFCLLAVLMLVPVVYLVLALGRIQAGAFAAQGAAREAGRAFVTSPDEASARGRADAAAAIAFADQGFRDPAHVAIEVGCAGSPCLAPDERVTVRSRVLVVLPGVPRLLDRVLPARVEVTARHVSTVDRFRGR
jgi:Flp pilus assembly protein TadG